MKILYFYPENPLHSVQGNNARALALLNYFNSKNFEVDFVAENSKVFTTNAIDDIVEQKLAKNVYLLKNFNRKKNQIRYFFQISLPNKIFGFLKDFNRVRIGQSADFNKILKSNSYDLIVISYAYWANLIKDNPNLKNAKLIVDTHDFLTAQFQVNKHFELGKYFEKEIENLSFFDEILVISNEENFLFSQFIKKPIHTITHALPVNFSKKSINNDFDMIYVASDNNHNVDAAKWFFEKVYPILPKNLKIGIIGKIGQYCPDFDNVTKIKFVENLDDVYDISKIAICPMLSGTGLKIKVIEALSFGLPVVCNSRGLDGLINKTNNGCLSTDSNVEFATQIIKLLSDSSFYEEQSNLAKNYFLENHSIEKSYINYDNVFKV